MKPFISSDTLSLFIDTDINTTAGVQSPYEKCKSTDLS
jgi:hypothetical protein